MEDYKRMLNRKSSRVIVFTKEDKDSIYLIYRKKHGDIYYVVPGGGVEDCESYVDAANREIMEELGLTITNLKLLEDLEFNTDYCRIFTADELDKHTPTGDEMKNFDPNNYYEVQIHKLKDVKHLNLKPESYQKVINELIYKEY